MKVLITEIYESKIEDIKVGVRRQSSAQRAVNPVRGQSHGLVVSVIPVLGFGRSAEKY